MARIPVGAFHQPSLVLADTACLATLPPREFRAGYAEVVKYGLIRDRAFFDWLEGQLARCLRRRPGAHSCDREELHRPRPQIVAGDEFESGERALLNFGHTFGHALERLVRYDGAVSCMARRVAIGHGLRVRFSVRRGLCQPAGRARRSAFAECRSADSHS